MHQTVYKVTDASSLAKAEAAGALEGSLHDLRDGFIHLSAATQLEGTLAKHFQGEDQLVLLAIDAVALGNDLRWEPSRGGEEFPHLYRSLPLAAVLWTEPLPVAADGSHPLPEKVGAALGLKR